MSHSIWTCLLVCRKDFYGFRHDTCPNRHKEGSSLPPGFAMHTHFPAIYLSPEMVAGGRCRRLGVTGAEEGSYEQTAEPWSAAHR